METIDGLSFNISKDDNDMNTLEVIVSEEVYKKEIDKQVEEYKPKVVIKGFRVGHAPKEIILARYKEALENSASEALIEECWNKFQDNNTVASIGMPKLSKMEKEGEGIKMAYEFYQMPEVTSVDLSTISLEKDTYIVDDKSLDEGHKRSIRRFSEFVETDNKALVGDRVTVALEFSDEKNKKYNKEFTVAATDATEDSIFAKESLGVAKGDKKTLSTTVGEDDASLTMNVVKVETPDMKDDTKEEDIVQMKDALKAHLEERAQAKSENDFTDKVLYDHITTICDIAIPKGYLEEQVVSTLANLKSSLLRQGSTIEDYLIATNKKMTALEDEYKDSVKKQIVFDLIMADLAKNAGDDVVIDEAKMQEYAEKMYQYQNYMGLSKRPKDEQQNVVNGIMREAQNKAMSEAIVNYVKSKIQITEKAPVSFTPKDEDLWMGY